MSVPFHQTKFNNGEVSSALWGDVSHPKYGASLRTCKNWLPIPVGPLVRRPGTKFIAHTKNDGKVRLIPFVFSDAQTFVLEFGNLYIRFYQNGQYVGLGGLGSGAYYELATTFTTAMLPYLKYSQVGDVVTICYGGQVAGVAALAPQDLRHTSGALSPWTITATPLKAGAVTWSNGPTNGVAAWSGMTTYKRGDRVTLANADGTHTEWISIQDANLNNSPPTPPTLNATSTDIAGTLYWTPVIDKAHNSGLLNYVYTAVFQDANGVTFESTASPTLAINTAAMPDRPFPMGGAVYSAGVPVFLYFNVYKSTSGLYGWIGVTTSGFLDNGITPDFTRQPPTGTDPFLVNGADSFPSVIGYFDQRRVWGASLVVPQGLWLSKNGDLYRYDLPFPGADTDSLFVVLISEVLESPRSFAAMRKGIILTGQGEWTLSGAQSGPISKSNVDPKRQSKWGANWLNPIIIGTGLLFNTAKSNMVRDLYPLYGLYSDIWDGQDLTVMSRHFFDNFTISEWMFQSVPFPIVRAVRSDGTILTLTYQHAPPSFGQQLTDGVVAWGQQQTGVGVDAYESVCVVPEPPEDAVYYSVRRVVNGATVRFIERENNPVTPFAPAAQLTIGTFPGGNPANYQQLAQPYLPDARYDIRADAALQFDGHNDALGLGAQQAHVDSVTNPGSTNVADFAAGKQITIALGPGGTPFVAGDAGPNTCTFWFDPENTLALNPTGGPPTARVVGYTSSTQVTAELDFSMTVAQLKVWASGFGAGYTKWGIGRNSYTVAHLAGYQQESGKPSGVRGVHVLADGAAVDPAVVTWAGGVATLPQPALVVCVGISYNADAASLDAHHPNAETRNRYKKLIRVGFLASNGRGMWAGQDFDKLWEWEEKTVAQGYGIVPLDNGYFETDVTDEWNKLGRMVVRSYDPLPMTLTAILREMELGGTG